jgi:pyruvate dehydrogenase E2 component (dihydrolipoamide acetyltransferase)
LLDVAAESRSLIEAARQGRLRVESMRGGVFTISNLGAYGIDGFTPIINYPEVAVLGLGAIRPPRPSGRGRRQSMVLSLTFDHAAVDGAPAAAFLRDLSASIAHAAASLIAGPRAGPS